MTEPGPELPGLPRGPLSPRQQLEALRRVQAQADQRVRLGQQLFKAVETHTGQHRALLAEVRQQQKQIDQQVQLQHQQWQRQVQEQRDGLRRQIAQDQKHFRDALAGEVAQSLQSYDQWLGRLDQGFTARMHQVEERLEAMDRQWRQAQQRLESLVQRAVAMLEQSRALFEAAAAAGPSSGTGANIEGRLEAAAAAPGSPAPASPGPATDSVATAPGAVTGERIYSRALDALHKPPPL